MRVYSKETAGNVRGCVLLLLLVGTGGCGPQGEKVDKAAVQHLDVSVCEEGLGVFRTEAEWKEFWKKHKVYGQGAVVPTVDFEKFTAILASTGRTNAGAASVTITGVVKHDGNMVEAVVFNEQAGENCAVTRVVACPTDVVLIPKGSYLVRFTEELRVANCQAY